MKVVKIDGIRGLITALFIGACLFAGFIVFPGYVAMYLWNRFLTSDMMLPSLSLFQGVLVWGMIAVTYFIVSKEAPAVSLQDAKSMSDAELKTIIQRAKQDSHLRNINTILNGKDTFEKLGKNGFEKGNLGLKPSSDREENADSEKEDSFRKLG